MTVAENNQQLEASNKEIAFFGRKYKTYVGEGNNSDTRNRGVPANQHIIVKPSFTSDVIAFNVRDPETKQQISTQDMRLTKQLISQQMKELLVEGK